jgi:glycosyltransferase involved in cell wall biosynthesis
MKKICFFGIYDIEYPRNKVLIQGFEENGYEVVHCNVNPKTYKGFKKYTLLYKKAKKLQGEKFDIIWVAFPGHTCVWLAKLLFPNTKIVFDVFISQYEANVSDRKVHKKGSFKAYKDWFLDWYGIRVADIVTIDTTEQIRLFQRNYGLNPGKAIRIFLSSALPVEEYSRRVPDGRFLVHFHGSFIPLHGVEYIVKAAKILEEEKNIHFRLVGGGQQLQEMKELAVLLELQNLEFVGRVPEYVDVLKYLKESDVMLGMFAKSGRGHWIIPNKIFEGMVFGKAIITADTPAMHELLTDRENVLFSKPGDSDDLALKILELYHDEGLRKRIGSGARELFTQRLSPHALVRDFLKELDTKK